MHGFLRELFYRREERDDGASVIYPKYFWPRIFSCGHTGPVSYQLEAFGQTFESKYLDAKNKQDCPECTVNDFLKFVIRCVNCAGPIVPGQIVLVVHTEPGDATKPGVRLLNGGKEVVMCCGPNCTQGDLTGWWNGEGVDKAK